MSKIQSRDPLDELGIIALGSRLRRLSDRVMADGTRLYKAKGIDFAPRWFPLFRLLAESSPLSIGECADALGVTHVAVSNSSKQMSDVGLITIDTDARDERRRLLSLTDDGRTHIDWLRPLWIDIETCVREIAVQEGVDLLSAVRQVEKALDEIPLDQRVLAKQSSRSSDDIEIVDFDAKYVDDFSRLNLEWIEQYFKIEDADRHHLDDPVGTIIEKGGTVVFAKVGDEVVGTCGLAKVDDETYELIKMAVSPTVRGRGVGRKLGDAVIAWAQSRGAKKVELETNHSFIPAIRLYEKLGFKYIGQRPDTEYDRSDYVMELDLAR